MAGAALPFSGQRGPGHAPRIQRLPAARHGKLGPPATARITPASLRSNEEARLARMDEIWQKAEPFIFILLLLISVV